MNLSEIELEIQTNSLTTMHSKMFAKRRPFCQGLNVLNILIQDIGA